MVTPSFTTLGLPNSSKTTFLPTRRKINNVSVHCEPLHKEKLEKKMIFQYLTQTAYGNLSKNLYDINNALDKKSTIVCLKWYQKANQTC
jgi:hypothetical protein